MNTPRRCCLNCTSFKVERGCSNAKGERYRKPIVMPAAPRRCDVFALDKHYISDTR